MMFVWKQPWYDIRLRTEEMDFLWDACSGPEHKKDYSSHLVGNISKSELIEDKDNWFYETALKKQTEKMFYRNCNNYYEKYIEGDESLPNFKLESLWVNYMKQHEFNPIHNHGGDYSFVVFMKIPTHWKEQHALPFSANSNAPSASDFSFMRSEKNIEGCAVENFKLCSEDEGRMLFFPAIIQHMVYPFYGTEEERVTISGNIVLQDPNRSKEQEKRVSEYEEKERILKYMEIQVEMMKKELEGMEKTREKGG